MGLNGFYNAKYTVHASFITTSNEIVLYPTVKSLKKNKIGDEVSGEVTVKDISLFSIVKISILVPENKNITFPVVPSESDPHETQNTPHVSPFLKVMF